ncbi:MAG: M23 family metallopeptidase [Acidobacteriota bacterium]
MRRIYTLMLVPHEGGAPKRFSVSGHFLGSLALLFVFCFVSSAFLGHVFLSSLNKIAPLQKIQTENVRQTREHSRLVSSLQATVAKVDELTARLEEYADLHQWPVDESQGGSLENLYGGAPPALQDDWQGMAEAAQAKASLWSNLYAQQICTSTSFLESLPTIWPVHGRVTSGYQWRKDPFTGKPQFHRGIDIAAERGTPVLAPADGVITFAGRKGGYGNCVKIDHGNGRETLYGHLHKMHVEVGQVVHRADLIGEVGSTGRASGPHLHYEILEAGERVNPLKDYLKRQRNGG